MDALSLCIAEEHRLALTNAASKTKALGAPDARSAGELIHTYINENEATY